MDKFRKANTGGSTGAGLNGSGNNVELPVSFDHVHTSGSDVALYSEKRRESEMVQLNLDANDEFLMDDILASSN
jgi:hypothetical protein